MSKKTDPGQMVPVKVIRDFCNKHIEECDAYITILNSKKQDSKLYQGIRMGYKDLLLLL